MKTSNFAQGTTAVQDFQLLTVDTAGTETPFDATAGGGVSAVFTITLVLTSAATGAAVDTVGDVAWLSPVDGTVRYSPDSADLTAAGSPYNVRWKVVDANGLIDFFPDGVADRWVVRL
jgi:hypothetical protein